MAEQPPANPPSDQPGNEPGFKPYVGPRTFRPNEGALFFGRDREARDLTARIISERFTLFYAQSGAGKSSLINTRILPGLAAQGFEVLPVARVSGHAGDQIAAEPVAQAVQLASAPESHATQLASEPDSQARQLALRGPSPNIFVYNLLASLHQRDTEPPGLASMTIAAFLDNLVCHDDHFAYDPTFVWPEDAELKPRVLIIDQFEEILTTNSAYWKQREAFFQQLGQALAADDLLWLVLSLREDFIAGLDPYLHLVNNGVRQRFYMQHLDRNAALDAIRLPVKDVRPFEPDAADTLVNNLLQLGRVGRSDEPAQAEFVEPVQLQAVCYQMWEKLQTRPGPTITCQDVEDFADVDTALVSFYEDTIAETVAETGVSELDLRHWFDSRLVTEAGTRNMVFRGAEETGGLPTPVADAVRARFIVREVVRPGGLWYELVHDRFIKPIQDSNRLWLQDQPLLQLAQQWVAAGRPPSLLLTADQLAEYETTNWEALGPVMAEFMDVSGRQSRDDEKRRRRIQLALGGAAIAALLGLAIFLGVVASNNQARSDELATINAELAQSNATKDANATAAAQARGIVELQVNALSTSRAELAIKSSEVEALRLIDAADNYLEQGQLEAAILFSYEAYAKDDAPRVRAVLFDALDSKIGQANLDTPLRGIYAWPSGSDGQSLTLSGLMSGPEPDTLAALSDGQLITWPLDDPSRPSAVAPIAAPLPVPSTENRNVLAAAFSPAGNLLAVSTGDAFYLWPLEEGAIAPTATVEGSLIPGLERVSALAFSADGRRLAAARACLQSGCPSPFTIDVWNVAPGDPAGPLRPARVLSATGPVVALSFADAAGQNLVWSDGLTLAMDGIDSAGRVILPRLSARKAIVSGLAAAPGDGLLVATGCFPPDAATSDAALDGAAEIANGSGPSLVSPDFAVPGVEPLAALPPDATPKPTVPPAAPASTPAAQSPGSAPLPSCAPGDEGWVELWFLGSGAPFGRGLSGQLQSPTYLPGRGQFIFVRLPATSSGALPATGEGALPFWLADRDAWPAAACAVAGRNLTAAEWLDFNPELSLADYAITCADLPIHPSVIDGLLAQCRAAPDDTAADACWADLERIAGVPFDPAAVTAVEDKIDTARDSYARQRRTTTMRHLAEAGRLLRAVPEPIATQLAASIRSVSEAICLEFLGGTVHTDSPAVTEACRQAGPLDLSAGSAEVEAGGAVRLWRFDGRAGDTLSLAVEAREGGDATLTLYDSQLIEVAYNDDSAGFNPGLLTQLPEDGVYTVAVNWLGVPGAYALRAAREQPRALSLGAPVRADSAGQRLWQLPAAAGDLVTLRLVTDEPNAWVQLRDPAFQSVSDTDNVLDKTVTALITTDDDYLVEVGWSGPPGDYVLTADRVVAAPVSPGDSIEADADRRFWRFDGRAGEVVTVAAEAPGADAKLILFAPDGSRLAENDDDLTSGLNPRLETLLLADGPHIIEVDWVGEVTAPYTLTADIRSPEPLPLDTTTTVIGRQFWSLTGQQGDTLAVDARALGGGNSLLRLYDAQFFELITANDAGSSLDPYLSFRLPADGDYYLDLDWAGVPDAAEVSATLRPPAPLVVGDAMAAESDQRVWSLTGNGLAMITVEGQAGADTWLELYDGDGNFVTYNDSFSAGLDPGFIVTLSDAPVMVVVGDWSNAPFAYTIRAAPLATASLIAGEPAGAGPDERLWAFDGRGGELVTFFAQGVDGSVPILNLYDERFAWLASGYNPVDADYSQLAYLLPNDSRFYVEISWSDDPGDYTLRAETAVPQELPLQVTAASQVQAWPFRGAAGDVLTAALLAPADAFGAIRLVNGQNVELFYAAKEVGQTSAQLAYTLPTDGPYMVEVNGDATLTPYDLTISSVAPVALPLDISVPGGEGEQTTWVFAGRAGDIIAITARSLDGGDMLLDLYDAQNNFLASSDDFSDIDPYLMARLPADGAYSLDIHWSDWSTFLDSNVIAPQFGPFRLTVAVMTPQPLSLGDDVLLGTPEQRLWRFDGQAGDGVTLSAEPTAGSDDRNLWLRLFDADLNTIAFSDNADGLNPAITTTLPASGEYFIEVGWFGDEGGFRLNTSVE